MSTSERDDTTIRVFESTRDALFQFKQPGESYDDMLRRELGIDGDDDRDEGGDACE